MVEEEVERRNWHSKTLLPPVWRDELLLTSSGVGHMHRDPPPEATTKRTVPLPLPPPLRGKHDQSAGQGYLTTNRMHHTYQPHGTVLTHPPHNLAMPSYKVHHNENFRYRLGDTQNRRRPLNYESQLTEQQDQFRGLPEKPLISSEFGRDLRHIDYIHHLEDGPLKKLNPTEPQADPGTSAIRPHERGVLQRMDRYATTSGQVHRPYSRKEQLELPRPNQASVYACQQYPKAWGYATNDPMLSLHAVPQERGRDMRDTMKFKHRCHDIAPSYQLPPVPFNGQHTIHQTSFLPPTREDMQATFASPLPRQHHITAPVDFGMPVAPKMYQPLNTTYGTAPF